MNLALFAALVAVAGAAKLDRTYLPPASAKTAGGNSGDLKTPFHGNSFNNGLGGIPKGSYTNDAQGVVVDAAAPGTRASEAGESGLGAPRISYGSTNSKVGAAAFKHPAGFRQTDEGFDGQTDSTETQFQSQFNQNPQQLSPQGSPQGPERPRAALDRAASTLRFESDVGPESFSYGFETDNGITAEESGVATNGVQAQGGFSYTGDDGQVYTVTYTADEGGYQPKGDHLPTPPPIPEEILRSLEQNARDEAAGLIDDGSYDAQKYNAGSDYADSDNSNDKYNHQSSNFGHRGDEDATASGTFINQNSQAFARPGNSGSASSSAHASVNGNGAIANRFGKPTNIGSSGQSANNLEQSGGQDGANTFADNASIDVHSGSSPQGQFGSNSNRFSGHFGPSSSQGQHGSNVGSASSNPSAGNNNEDPSFSGSDSDLSNSVQGATQSPNNFNKGQHGQISFGNRNEYLPPKNTFGQNSPLNSRLQGFSQKPNGNTEENTNNQNEGVQPLSQQSLSTDRPQLPGFSNSNTPSRRPIVNGQNRPNVNGQSAFNNIGSTQPQASGRPSSNGATTFSQSGSDQLSGNDFGNRNEYLPPKNNFNQNSRSGQNRPQGSNSFLNQHNEDAQPSANIQSTAQDRPQGSFSASSSASVSGPQSPQNSFKRPQPSHGNRFSSTHEQGQISGSPAFSPQKGTSPPATELTTPLEDISSQDNANAGLSKPTSTPFASSQFTSRRPSQPQSQFGFNNGANIAPTSASASASFGSQSGSQPQRPISRPQSSFVQSQSAAFSTPLSNAQYDNESQFGNKQPSPFSQGNDAQFASSTLRPSYSLQEQGPDDSYYYKQPAKPLRTPQGSRFPSTPSDQSNRVSQRPSNSAQNNRFSTTSQLSQSSFPSQNQQPQGSSRYPQPPTLAPVSPTTYQGQSNGFTGITQASISPFPSEQPTQSTQFSQQNKFGTKPNQQSSNLFSQSQFGKPQGSIPSFTGQHNPSVPSLPQRSSNGKPAFQSQSFEQQSQNQGDEMTSESVPSQQYSGEIYQYDKPAQSLPAPDHDKEEEHVSNSGQFGLKQQQQFGQKNNDDSEASTTAPLGQTIKPQFGSQSRPQFGQQTQNNFRPQQSQSRPFSGNQFNPNSEPESPQPTQGSQPQTGTNSGHSSRPCCQNKPSSTQDSQFGRPSQGFQNQNQFSSQGSGINSNQGFKPDATTSNFAGKGEQFGGPRKPPSFDEKTGYHY